MNLPLKFLLKPVFPKYSFLGSPWLFYHFSFSWFIFQMSFFVCSMGLYSLDQNHDHSSILTVIVRQCIPSNLWACEHSDFKKKNFRRLDGTMPLKICNVASVCCQKTEFCYEALNMFYWSLNLLQQSLCLSEKLLNHWLSSSWTLYHWSQPFQLSSPTSFQPTPPSSYLATPHHLFNESVMSESVENWKLYQS